VGIAPIFYYNSFSFLAMIVALSLMRLPALPAVEAQRPLPALREGLAYVRRSRAVVLILLLVTVVATFAMNFSVLMPIFAHDVLGAGGEGLGWMWTALGIGAVIGSMTVVRWSRVAVAGPLLLGAAAVCGLAELGMAAATDLAVTLVVLGLVGWGTGAFFAGASSAIQARVDNAVRGRVLSVYSMIFAGTGPISGLLAAGLAALGGAPLSLAVGGGICAASALLLAPFFTRHLAPLTEQIHHTAVEESAS
jgi:predicted MFS family arabinose efflux permease